MYYYEVLADYTQEEVITNDLGHYTGLGISKFSEYIDNYLNKECVGISRRLNIRTDILIFSLSELSC